jgi:hypothetical protein
MTAVNLEVKHGYTLHDLDQMTRAAVIADRSQASDIQSRKDIAWSAIAEHLCASEDPPHRQDLIRVGWQAIYRDARDAYRQRGRPDKAWEHDEPTFRPRFAMYWADFAVTPSHENQVVESIAAGQVIAPLTPTYRDAIVALAVHDDYRLAAQALGLKDKAFQFRISAARRQILARWFEGETPHRPRRTDRRVGVHGKPPATCCSKGHEWTPENTYVRRRLLRGKPHTSRVCRACEHDRGAVRRGARRAS